MIYLMIFSHDVKMNTKYMSCGGKRWRGRDSTDEVQNL